MLLHAAQREPERRAEVIEVVVPVGTADLHDQGDHEALLPTRLEVQVGDTLVIDNQDTRSHEVGPYLVAAGERLEQTFNRVGVFEGECTLNPDGRVRIVVG